MTKLNAYTFPDEFIDFAFMPHFDEDIEKLIPIVESENWCFKNTISEKPNPILRKYIIYTYKRISEEKKIVVTEDEAYACWNTGLVSSSQEPVYMLLEKNKLEDQPQYWHFGKFCRKGQRELTPFTSLPEMAHYFENPSDLVYDTRKDLRINIEHIVAENHARFPEKLKSMQSYGLQNLVKGAIDSAKERVKRNYKTAIPQYYKGTIQLLLPLCLTDVAIADMAITVERFPDFYRVATCLTLDMAYNNARQLARPDRDWLDP